MEWVLGGWAAAATAAACTLFVIMSRPRTDGPVAPIPGKPAEPAQPILRPGKYSLNVAPTVRLRGPSRGRDDTAPIVTVGPNARILRIVADPPDLPNGSRVTLRLTGPEGNLLLDDAHPIEDLFGTEILTLQSPEPLRPGRYVLEIAWQEDSTPQRSSLPFTVRVAER